MSRSLRGPRELPQGRRVKEPFIFGIPLIARDAAQDWELVERLFALTLRSVLAQTDPNFQVVLAAHDVPRAWSVVAGDPRFMLAPADWVSEPPTSANDDGGLKKWRIKQRVRDLGGGLLMFLDADDWIASDLVETTRASMQPHHVGGVVSEGFALDLATLRSARFPLAGVFEGPFHGLCGSSTIGRVVASASEPERLDPHLALGSHHEWLESAVRQGFSLAEVPSRGAYLVGTGQNHSEIQGPFAQWRRRVTASVRAHGQPLDAPLARCFGQDIDELRSLSSAALPAGAPSGRA